MKVLTKVLPAAGLLAGLLLAPAAQADITFRNAVTGETLDLSYGKKGPEEAFKKFQQTGKNPYNGNKEAVEQGHSLYLTGCSGCHGHDAEGKLGPGLADDYWTYPRALSDVGLFEILFGGAQGMMGPQYTNMSNDDLLKIMSWIRSLYTGDPAKAEWLK